MPARPLSCLAGATWSGQLVPVARLACLLLASENIEGGRKAVGDKKYFKNTCANVCARSCVYGETVVFSPYNTVFLEAETAYIHQFSFAFFSRTLCTISFQKERKALLSVATVCSALYCTVWGECFMFVPFLWLSGGEIHSLTTVWNAIGFEWIAFTLSFEIYVYLAHAHARFF